MICPNCGRRNSAGATFCSRCRQRLPLATKLNGTPRRATIVEPRGGGGSGAIVLAVALVAGFLFIGGAAAIYLSSPPGDPGDSSFIGDGSASPTLPPFVQFTASPIPTPSPTFILLPSELFSPSPSVSGMVTPAAGVTPTPGGPTAAPTPQRVVARFDWNQQGASKDVKFTDKSKGNPTQWSWNFGDGSQGSTDQDPQHQFPTYGNFTVKLTVTGAGGSSTETKTVSIAPAPTDPPTAPPTPPPTEPPTTAPTDAPTAAAAAQIISTEGESPTP